MAAEYLVSTEGACGYRRRWLGHGAGEGWARVRIVLAILWLTCLVGPPIITRLAPLPLVPVAVSLLGWAVLDTWRAAEARA